MKLCKSFARGKSYFKISIATLHITSYRIMICRPRLSAITHVASCPEREIDIATAGASPIIFPAATYKQKPIKVCLD